MMGVVRIEGPLCPAGHLPHKGGEDSWRAHHYLIKQGAGFTPSDDCRASGRAQRFSPLVGEMPGRAERAFFQATTPREAR